MGEIPQLRDYQLLLKQDCYKAIEEENRSILNVLATGGGKTIIFCDIANDYIKQNKRVWILTHTEEIRLQTISKLVNFGLQPGQIAAGQPLTSNSLQVVSVQTLINQIEVYLYAGYSPDVIIIDEAHHAVANTWKTILTSFSDCINLGFTATPLRLDGIGLGDIYTYLNEGPQAHHLVERGYLADPILFTSPLALEVTKIPVKIVNGDYSKREQTVIMSQQHIVQETTDCYRKYFNGAPIIIFCTSIEDCHVVDDAMEAHGWKGNVVKSGMDSDLRNAYIDNLGNGKFNYLCSYEILGEGVDIPILSGVILRRRTLSLAKFLQMVGRGGRLYTGKTRYIIVDQAANYFIHGHPLDHRHWSLEGKKSVVQKSRPIVVCPNGECLAVLSDSPPECPYCGINLKTIKEGKSKSEPLALKVINAEFLQIHTPEIIENDISDDEIPIESSEDLLERVIDASLPLHTQRWDIASKLHMLDNMLIQDPYTKKAWNQFLQGQSDGS